MIMNIGLLILLMVAIAYIMIPTLFMQGRYSDVMRERYEKVLGGRWSRRKNITFEIAAVLITIFLIILLTLWQAR